MQKTYTETLAEKKRKQAAALYAIATLRGDGITEKDKDTLSRLTQELESEGDLLDKKARDAESVLVLPKNATDAELAAGRAKQATQRGDEVYLPFWGAGEVALPSCFVRSALFPASTSCSEAQERGAIETWQPNVSITLAGSLLSSDRRVFAACLLHYQNKPLADGENGEWIETTLHQLGKSVGLSQGSTTIAAARASLQRLSEARLVVRQNGMDSPVSPLVDVAFSPDASSGRDKVKIRVQKTLAPLYGKNQWRRIPLPVVTLPGVAGWVGCFYASHSAARWLSLSGLHRVAGARCKLADFRKLLLKAFETLGSKDIPEIARICRIEGMEANVGNDDKETRTGGQKRKYSDSILVFTGTMLHDMKPDK